MHQNAGVLLDCEIYGQTVNMVLLDHTLKTKDQVGYCEMPLELLEPCR